MVLRDIKVVINSISHTRGSSEGTSKQSHAGLVNIKIIESSSMVFFPNSFMSHPYYIFKKILCGLPSIFAEMACLQWRGELICVGGMSSCTNVIEKVFL